MMAQNIVALQRHGECAVIVVNNPPVNASARPVRQGIMAALDEALGDESVRAIVVACDGRTFIAGADIREFGKPPLDPNLAVVIDRMEQADKPIVAAIHGTALGGGFELALGCHARIAVSDAKMGLPEVKLGIIPGAGGTQRLPRLTGPVAALDIIGSGRHVPASEALALGMIDGIATNDLRTQAMELGLSLVGKPLRRTGELAVPAFDQNKFDAAAMKLFARARGQVSPLKVIEAVRLATLQPISAGLVAERATFVELVDSAQARALRYAFFSERTVQNVSDIESIPPRRITTVGVIGAGTMGAGIAYALLVRGFEVAVLETDEVSAGRGQARIQTLLDKSVATGRIDDAMRSKCLGALTVGHDQALLTPAQLIIEAAIENMEVKKEIFGRLGALTAAGTILATNTSYLDVDEIARACSRPDDVLGLHFFSPAHIMRLIEVVRGRDTSKEALATGIWLAKRLGKLPVTCGVCDGFVGNRILARWRQIAEFAVEEGALPEEVDAAVEAFGFAMGPFTVVDLAGVDVAGARRKKLRESAGNDVRYSGTLADRLCELGRLGQKTSGGYYDYVEGKKQSSSTVRALIEETFGPRPQRQQPFDSQNLVRRIRAAIVNEGAKILEEGIVDRPESIDAIQIHGYGYPVWRGGPMFEANEIGLASILEDVRALHQQYGCGWEPAKLLEELAARPGGSFHE